MNREQGTEQGRTLRRGVALALGAAFAFGSSVPIIQRASRGAGPFATSGLLYAGAALLFGASLMRVSSRAQGEVPLGRAQLPLVAAMTILGAVMAPALLVWGLARTSSLSASLLLNAEGAFTVVLAARMNRERLGARLIVAVLFVVAGSSAIVLGIAPLGTVAVLGTLAALGATIAWATDSVLASRLWQFDGRAIVTAKSALGAILSLATAILLAERWPEARAALVLVGVGAVSYGLSLHLYLMAQRVLGAARAGALFSSGPFIGAVVAMALGDRAMGWAFGPAAALLAIGVWLQVDDRHTHSHHHPRLAHDHRHSHDDLHHDHEHDPMPDGPHSHPHEHDERVHDHPHGDDPHHRHH